MTTWYKCDLGDAMLAGDALDKIQMFFDDEYRKNGQPKEMALFVRHESEGRLHCSVNIYFPPAAAMIAKAFGATPCRKPSRESLGFLTGSRDA